MKGRRNVGRMENRMREGGGGKEGCVMHKRPVSERPCFGEEWIGRREDN